MEQINQYLTFRMQDEEYALNISNVKEILEVPVITRIPRMPDFMTGVINLRGNVLPVVDLRRKFGLGNTEIATSTAIIVIEVPSGENNKIQNIGIFADEVHKVITIEPSAIEPPPKINAGINTSFMAGMGHVDGKFVTILEITEILTARELERTTQTEIDHAVTEPIA